MFSKNHHSHWWSLLILALVAFAYLIALARPAALSSSGPVYRAGEGVGLECVVRWEAQSLPRLLEMAEEEKVPVNFFVPLQYASEHPQMLKEMSQKGCETGLLVCSQDRKGILSELEAGAAAFSACGIPLRFVMAEKDENAALVESAASKEELCTVISSFDLLNRSSDGGRLVQRIEKETFDGAIIRFEPTKTIAESFLQILDALRAGGFVPQTLSALLG